MTDISVIVPSYNHADYVMDAVASVLSQTVPVHEVIVVDDASTDDSVMRLRQLADPRLRIIALERNAGGGEALNIGIRTSSSPLIAICNSDDLWEPVKLERQLPWLEANPDIGAVFTDVTWIGKFGEELDRGRAKNIFRVPNRSRHAWIRRLVETGNCLCHPSVLIRRGLYDNAGYYDNRLRQLPDYKMWLAVLMQTELHVMDEKLVRFRIHENTSAPSPSASTRDRNECFDILLDLMANMTPDDFFLAFGSRLPPTQPDYNLAVEKSLYLWSVEGHTSAIAFSIANRLCLDLLATDAGKAAWKSYGFAMLDFHLLRGIESPWVNARGDKLLTDAEYDVLRRVGAITRAIKPAVILPRRQRMTHKAKIRREIRRIGRQVTSFLSQPIRLRHRAEQPPLLH